MKEKYQKFLLFSFVFFLGIFLFLLKPQTIFSYSFYCNNGPNENDGGGCGTPCHCGQPWTMYYKSNVAIIEQFCEITEGITWYVWGVGSICPTGNVCRLGEYGLRYGTCDCFFGPIYKTCCSGSTKVLCERYPGWPEVYQRGRCPAGTSMVDGTSCPSSPPPEETHKVCSGTSCVTVPGAGTNECSLDPQCVSAPPPTPVPSSCHPLTDAEAQCYLNRYPDLQAAFGPNNIAAAKQHWLTNGCNEGRDYSCPGGGDGDGGGAGIEMCAIYPNLLYL